MNYYVSGELKKHNITLSFGLQIIESNEFMAAIAATRMVSHHFAILMDNIEISNVEIWEEEDD